MANYVYVVIHVLNRGKPLRVGVYRSASQAADFAHEWEHEHDAKVLIEQARFFEGGE